MSVDAKSSSTTLSYTSEHYLLAKVNHSRNQLYVLDLRPMQSVCLAARQDDEPWL